MKKIKIISLAFIIIYLILLIPLPEEDNIEVAQRSQFEWKQDSLWYSLEKEFTTVRETGCANSAQKINTMLNSFSNLLESSEKKNLNPDDEIFDRIQNLLFQTAPLIGACPDSAQRYINLISRLRQFVKNKSRTWNPDETTARRTLYKTLYGGRAAAEEIILQSDKDNIPSLTYEIKEPSATPYTTFLGVQIHSGDILISRGGAPTSALISRGSDYPGNFSHVALVYVDPQTNIAAIIEAHIEIGVAVASLEDYMNDKKLRVMVLRLRSDLPELINDPMLPHKAAEASLNRAQREHIPYDFEMDYNNPDKLFCSEVASSVYRDRGINLWMGKSTISSIGTAELLAGFGVKYFETQEPSDLEYDPQLSVVAEWRDGETLYKDHIDNAIVDAILEWVQRRGKIETEWYMLPVVRVLKLYSLILNTFDNAGPVPEGMSAESALRHRAFKNLHDDINGFVLSKSKVFINLKGYNPPYWRLYSFAKDYFPSRNL